MPVVVVVSSIKISFSFSCHPAFRLAVKILQSLVSVVNFMLKKFLITLELDLIKAKASTMDTTDRLKQFESRWLQLKQNLHSLKEIISLSEEDENHVLPQKTSNATPRSIRSGFAKTLSDESTTPSKMIGGLVSQGLSGSRHAEFSFDEQQDNYKILSRCIKQILGFLEGKPVAAAFIYRCLVHRNSFEVERTAILDFIIEGINDVLKDGNENGTFLYWLTNTSALLSLVQRNLSSDGSLTADSQRSAGSGGLESRFNHGPAIIFEQQLTACLEKIFALIRDNFKKEISPLLRLPSRTFLFHP